MTRGVIYGKLAEYFDGINQPKDYAREGRELIRLATQHLGRRPGSLLDVGCGTGLHLAEFRKTVSVAGVDLSRDMLRIARHRLGRRVRLVKGDMRTFDLGERFDVVTCLFSAIAYMTSRRDRDLAIANFYRHLNPGGVALVEGWVLPERWRGTSVAVQSYSDSDSAVARVVSAWRERTTSVLDFQWLVARRGHRVEHYTEMVRSPLVSSNEMLRSFRRAGFRARIVTKGRFRDRGLYVGTRPATT